MKPALSFILTFILFATLRLFMSGISASVAYGPLLSPALLLFVFHMLSDPTTTPRTRNGKITFGISVATVDFMFRAAAIPNGQFYALVISTCALAGYSKYLQSKYLIMKTLRV